MLCFGHFFAVYCRLYFERMERLVPADPELWEYKNFSKASAAYETSLCFKTFSYYKETLKEAVLGKMQKKIKRGEGLQRYSQI